MCEDELSCLQEISAKLDTVSEQLSNTGSVGSYLNLISDGLDQFYTDSTNRYDAESVIDADIQENVDLIKDTLIHISEVTDTNEGHLNNVSEFLTGVDVLPGQYPLYDASLAFFSSTTEAIPNANYLANQGVATAQVFLIFAALVFVSFL